MEKIKRPAVDWCVISGTNMKCLHCGETRPLNQPLPIKAFCRQLDGFQLLHADCKPEASGT